MKALTIFKTFVWISTLILGSAAYSDVVTDWNTAALNVIRANRTPPPKLRLKPLICSIRRLRGSIVQREERPSAVRR